MTPHDIRGINLDQKEIGRYARHLTLEEIGIAGQKKLKASSVLCIGSGGLGSPVLLYLAAAGVGKIGIVDFDVVDESNLQRQIIHGMKWLNKSKADSSRARILDINPNCKVDIFKTKLTKDNALKIIQRFDLVCDCTDNFPSRYLINDACVILGKPNVYGSIARFEGQATVFNLNENSPNYRDLVPNPPPPGALPSCEEGGVLGVLPGLIGLIQATEAIKIITGIGEILNGRLLILDALQMRFRELSLKPSINRKEIRKLIDYETFCTGRIDSDLKETSLSIESISANKLKEILKSNPDDVILLDVRNQDEYDLFSIKEAILIPLQKIENEEAIEYIRELTKGRKLYVHCKSGKRSMKALVKLSQRSITGINVTGGINAWASEISVKD